MHAAWPGHTHASDAPRARTTAAQLLVVTQPLPPHVVQRETLLCNMQPSAPCGATCDIVVQRVTLCCNMLSWHVAHIMQLNQFPPRCPSTHTSPRCVPPTTASRVRHAARCSAFGRRVAAVACIAECAFRRYDVELFQRIEELLGRKMDECAAAPPTSAPGLDTPSRICTGTGLTPPQLHRDCGPSGCVNARRAYGADAGRCSARPSRVNRSTRSTATGNPMANIRIDGYSGYPTCEHCSLSPLQPWAQ